MKKKIVPILLSSAMIAPSFLIAPTAHANSELAVKSETTIEMPKLENEKELQKKIQEAKITKEEALKIADSFFKAPSGYKQQSIQFHSNWYPGNNHVWTINWSKQEDQFYGHINITVDANSGNIIEFSHNENKQNKKASYPPAVNRDKAKELALSFIKKQFPNKINEIEYDSFNDQNMKPPLDGEIIHYLKFDRVVNGYPYQENYVSVNVNGDGEIIGFNFRWDDKISFPQPKNIISEEKAINLVKQTYPIQLSYQTIYEMNQILPKKEDNKQNIVLSYEQASYFPFLDATTGKWMDYQGRTATTDEILSQMEPLVESKLADDPTSLKKELTSDQAIEKIKEYFSIPSDMELENVNYSQEEYNGNQSIWHLNWRNLKNHLWVNASVNAKTGEIMSFNKGIMYPAGQLEDSDKTITFENGEQKAIEFLKKIVPHKMHQLTLRNTYIPTKNELKNMREYHYNFSRLKNGVLVSDQSVSISVSAETGEVVNFYQHWNDDIEFPNSSAAISLENAKEKYFNQFQVKPKYILIHEDYSTKEAKMPIAKLVYELRNVSSDEPLYFDAIKGDWASRRTGEVISEVKEALDIKGHWAEEPLQLMIDYKAIEVDENGKVYPSKNITRGEMIKMLMLTTNPDPYYYKMSYEFGSAGATFNDVSAKSEYFAYVESAVRSGLIDTSKKEFKPEELVSREEMAELIVRALDFYELSKIDNLFNADFKDQNEIKNKGAAAIVKHLDIMKGNDGFFNPNEKISRAEAAKVYFEYLKKRGQFEQTNNRYY